MRQPQPCGSSSPAGAHLGNQESRLGKGAGATGAGGEGSICSLRVKVWSKERGQRAGMYGHGLGNVTERVRK